MNNKRTGMSFWMCEQTTLNNKTMKKIFLTNLVLFSNFTFAQYFGINTNTPQATMQVVGSPTDPSKMDGVMFPRIEGNMLMAKNYSPSQENAIVYVTTPPTYFNGNNQINFVNSKGFYFYDGQFWKKMYSKNYQKYSAFYNGSTTNSPINTPYYPTTILENDITGNSGVRLITLSPTSYIMDFGFNITSAFPKIVVLIDNVLMKNVTLQTNNAIRVDFAGGSTKLIDIYFY